MYKDVIRLYKCLLATLLSVSCDILSMLIIVRYFVFPSHDVCPCLKNQRFPCSNILDASVFVKNNSGCSSCWGVYYFLVSIYMCILFHGWFIYVCILFLGCSSICVFYSWVFIYMCILFLGWSFICVFYFLGDHLYVYFISWVIIYMCILFLGVHLYVYFISWVFIYVCILFLGCSLKMWLSYLKFMKIMMVSHW